MCWRYYNNTRLRLFYLQQKDETYPITKWRLALSVWGGAMEREDQSEEEAVLRELKEELDWQPTAINKIGDFIVRTDNDFPITIFEIVMSEIELKYFAANKISYEGNALLVDKNQIWQQPWIWDLDIILKPIYQK